MDENSEAYIRRRLDLQPMMDETPDEYIARREALLYRRQICKGLEGAGDYCRKIHAMLSDLSSWTMQLGMD